MHKNLEIGFFRLKKSAFAHFISEFRVFHESSETETEKVLGHFLRRFIAIIDDIGLKQANE